MLRLNVEGMTTRELTDSKRMYTPDGFIAVTHELAERYRRRFRNNDRYKRRTARRKPQPSRRPPGRIATPKRRIGA